MEEAEVWQAACCFGVGGVALLLQKEQSVLMRANLIDCFCCSLASVVGRSAKALDYWPSEKRRTKTSICIGRFGRIEKKSVSPPASVLR